MTADNGEGMAEIKKVGVVGCGLMGHGITQVTAEAGYAVVVREVDDAVLAKGIGKIEKQLARAVEKGKASQEDADAVRGRIEGTTDYGALADCDLVIEAITENLDLKLAMWAEVDKIVKPEALFATNTSSLPVINQAASTSRPDKFLGLHFFNPVQVMKLLEVVKAVTTSARGARGWDRVRAIARQADGADAGHRRLHREPAARSLHARRDACA